MWFSDLSRSCHYDLQGAVAHWWVHCQWSYSWLGRISGLIIPKYLQRSYFLAPPPRVGVSSVRFFFSLALSGFARSGLGVLVLVFSSFFLSSFAFPVSRPGWLAVISFSLSSHFHFPFICPAAAGCVCTNWRDVKLRCVAGDHRGPRGSVANEDTPWVPVTTYLLLISLGAYKSQLGGTNVYRCCFIWSTSTVIIRLYVYSYIYSSCHL